MQIAVISDLHELTHLCVCVYLTQVSTMGTHKSMDKKFVYVIEEVETGRIKIGRSKNPESRMRQLKTGNPNTLRIAMKKERAYSAKFETWLHQQFSKNRTGGEWFEGVTPDEVSSRLMGCLLWDWDVDEY